MLTRVHSPSRWPPTRYDTAEGSVDSGVVVAENEHFNNSTTSLKYLHV